MNILQKIVLLAVMLVSATTHSHIEELEAHTPCPLLFKESCILLK